MKMQKSFFKFISIPLNKFQYTVSLSIIMLYNSPNSSPVFSCHLANLILSSRSLNTLVMIWWNFIIHSRTGTELFSQFTFWMFILVRMFAFCFLFPHLALHTRKTQLQQPRLRLAILDDFYRSQRRRRQSINLECMIFFFLESQFQQDIFFVLRFCTLRFLIGELLQAFIYKAQFYQSLNYSGVLLLSLCAEFYHFFFSSVLPAESIPNGIFMLEMPNWNLRNIIDLSTCFMEIQFKHRNNKRRFKSHAVENSRQDFHESISIILHRNLHSCATQQPYKLQNLEKNSAVLMMSFECCRPRGTSVAQCEIITHHKPKSPTDFLVTFLNYEHFPFHQSQPCVSD